MTLIVTVIGNLGILQAADSNLTFPDSAGRDGLGTGTKVYPLGFCPGALALAGDYGIQDTPMDSWVPNAINEYAADLSPDLEGFAHYLGARLTAEGTPGKTGLLIHIAGYASDAQGSHPEMWFVRNYTGINEVTGDYIGLSDTYAVREDFWARDYPAGGRIRSQSYGYRYFNGLAEGRIQYHAFSRLFNAFLEDRWANPDWQFRQPRNLYELELFVKVEFRVIATLFTVSDYQVHVGGDARVLRIEPPLDAVAL